MFRIILLSFLLLILNGCSSYRTISPNGYCQQDVTIAGTSQCWEFAKPSKSYNCEKPWKEGMCTP